MEKLDAREAALQEEMAGAATDVGRLQALTEQLAALREEREAAEAAWLDAQERLEG